MLLTTTMAHHTPDHKALNPHSAAPSQTLPTSSLPHANPQHLTANTLFNPPPASPFQPRLASPLNKHINRPVPPFPVAPHPSTPTQSKWRVTPAQKEALLAAFRDDPYPELSRKNALAEQLGVTTTQISKWFQHRRESLTRLGQFKAQYNRTRRTPEELDVLQNAFEIDRYPTAERLAELESQLTNVTAKQIKLWFKHRRKQVQKRNRPTATTTTTTTTTNGNSPDPSPLLSPSHHNNTTTTTNNPTNELLVSHRSADRNTAAPIPDWGPVSPNLPAIPNNQQSVPTANMVAPSPSSTPLPYAISPSYYYKTPQMLVGQSQQFNELEVMALRGAFAVANGVPTAEAIARLAALVNRPVTVIAEWFRSQVAKPADPTADMNYMQTTFPAQSDQRPNPSSTFQGQGATYNTSSTGAGSHVQSDGGASQTPPLGSMPNTFESSAKSMGGDEAKVVVENARVGSDKSEAFPASDVVQSVHPSVYPGYMYTTGVITQPTVGFQQPQSSSAPMLAPLRYVPSSNVQPYTNANSAWYGPAPSYSKSS
eukprot:GFKZ01008114.1.p1 GENE.GFKZ01008114.1~~GFKZ01008114.1.p1  ORF type:complete len:540 (-),score=54.69 GFKZ01008114.1:1658-3277(-)